MDVSGEQQIDVDHDIMKQRLDLEGNIKQEQPEKEGGVKRSEKGSLIPCVLAAEKHRP